MNYKENKKLSSFKNDFTVCIYFKIELYFYLHFTVLFYHLWLQKEGHTLSWKLAVLFTAITEVMLALSFWGVGKSGPKRVIDQHSVEILKDWERHLISSSQLLKFSFMISMLLVSVFF